MSRCLALAVGLLVAVAAGPASADDMEGDVVYLPMNDGVSLTVENRLGTVRLRGWDEPQVRIVANKHAAEGGVATLERLKVKVDLRGGVVQIATGVYYSDRKWRQVPLKGTRIDLIVDAPRGMTVAASTFNGDIDASGFRGGAQLTSEHGEITAADISGKVTTRSRQGRQSLQAIHGPLISNGVEGDLELEAIDGATIDATVTRGQITAKEVTTPVVRLSVVAGTIIFVGGLRPGGRYELTTLEGDIRLTLRPTPFTLLARAPNGVTTAFPLRGGKITKEFVESEFQGGGASLELVSHKGSVTLARQ